MRHSNQLIISYIFVVMLIFHIGHIATAQPLGGSKEFANPLAAIRSELLQARDILLADGGAKKTQEALAPIERAEKIAGTSDFTTVFTGKVDIFRDELKKARLKILWNDRKDALAIVNHLLGMLDVSLCDAKSSSSQSSPTTPVGNGPGAGAMLGATLLAGLAAIVLLFFTGQVSHR